MVISNPDKNSIYNFQPDGRLNDWYIVDDVVMGGRSSGKMVMNEEGHGKFYGHVSLENNGGFSSVRYDVKDYKKNGSKSFKIRLKGDGKKYQFRVKRSGREYHSYAYNFQTSGEWEEIEIPFKQMYPTFRGRTLDMDNFKGEGLVEIGFLIANKRPESFELLIDEIKLD